MSITSSSPVVGVFSDQSMAEQAAEALYNSGFAHEEVWYSTPGNSGSFFEDLRRLFTGTATNEDNLASDLTTMGLSDEEAHYYSDQYSSGNTILVVRAHGREQEASSIVQQYGASNVQRVFNSAANPVSQQDDSTQQYSDDTQQSQPQFGTYGEQPFQDPGQTVTTPESDIEHEGTQLPSDSAPPEHEVDSYTPQVDGAAPEQEAGSQNALPGATGDNTSDWTGQPEAVAPEAHIAEPSSQADTAVSEYDEVGQSMQTDSSASDGVSEAQPLPAATATPEYTDELQQLQEQLRATQQQLEEVKTQLQTAKERETQIRTAKEREQQLQNTRQQLQDAQSELEVTLAELRETQARLAEYE